MGARIHPNSVVDPNAVIADDVEIGPFCVVGPDVKLAEGVRLLSHVVVTGNTSVGSGTVIHPFAALGGAPQDKKYKGEPTRLTIGRNNVIHEYVTMHVGTAQGRGETVVGDDGFFMAGAHIAHDAIVGNGCTFANCATIGGFAVVDDYVNLGGLCAVHQLVRVGPYAFCGGGAMLTGDLIPFGMVNNYGRLHGLNLVGLKRRGFPRKTIDTLRAVYRHLFEGEGHFEARVGEVAAAHAHVKEVMMIVDFINAGQKRPLCSPRSHQR